MWDESTRTRFAELRRKEDLGILGEGERTELAQLIDQLDALEGSYLTPATEQLRTDRQRLGDSNEVLSALVARKEALIQRLEAVLDEARTERAAIDAEVSRLLNGPASLPSTSRR